MSNVYSFKAPGVPSNSLTKLLELFQISQHASVIRNKMHVINKNQAADLVAAVKAFQSGDIEEGVVLGVLSPQNGGHAIVPYEIEENGTGNYFISIYDNNWPDDANRKMILNTNTGYWSYELWDGLTFSSSAGDYFGFANCKDVFDIVDRVTKISVVPVNSMNISVPRGSEVQNESGMNIDDIPEVYEIIDMSLMPGASLPDNQMYAAPAGQYHILSRENGNEGTFFNDELSLSAITDNSSATIDGRLGGEEFIRITSTIQNKFTIQYGTNSTAASPLILDGSAQGSFNAVPEGNGLYVTGAATLTASSGGRSKSYSVAEGQTIFIPYLAGGGNGGSSSSTTTSPATVTTKPDFPTRANLTLAPSPDENAVLTYTITKEMVQRVLDQAKEKGAKQGREKFGYWLSFDFIDTAIINSMNITFNGDALALLEAEGIKETTVTTNVFRFSLNLAAVKELNKQGEGNAVVVTASRFSQLAGEAKAYIGSRPAWDITINNGNITNLGQGNITMGMSYTPAAGEKMGRLAVIYVPGSGSPQVLINSSYENGWIIWQRSSLSVYGVGYLPSAPELEDTQSHWEKDNIDFAVSRNLISASSEMTFDPDSGITRGDFIMALGKLSGADVSNYTAGSFTDIGDINPAMPYVEWAVDNLIVQGIGDNIFGSDNVITREDMAVILYNYARATGCKIPVSRERVTFTDASQISAYASDAVAVVQQAGLIAGRENNQFNPQGSMTRAEACTILRRLVELAIDESTARGWVQDNGKWYYFDDSGKLAVNTSVDGYQVGADGAWK